MAERLAIAGVVGKPFGLAGEVHVRPDPDVADDVVPGSGYLTSSGSRLVVAGSRPHRGRRLVRFEGVDDRGAAEALRGETLSVPRRGVALAPDAFWTDELLGREVVDEQGQLVGVVESARDGAAHDYLVVARPDGGELLLPAVAELVEVTADAVVVHAIPGLLEP